MGCIPKPIPAEFIGKVFNCAKCDARGLPATEFRYIYEKRIRGLLCTFCNTGIGKFRDSPDLLRVAADYLENPIRLIKCRSSQTCQV